MRWPFVGCVCGIIGTMVLGAGCAANPPLLVRVDVSPDGTRRAVLFVERDGGALGSCRQFVLVEPARSPEPTPASLTERYRDVVFDCSCGEHPSTTWRGSADLEIGYRVDRFGISTHQTSSALDGQVRLRYVVSYD